MNIRRVQSHFIAVNHAFEGQYFYNTSIYTGASILVAQRLMESADAPPPVNVVRPALVVRVPFKFFASDEAHPELLNDVSADGRAAVVVEEDPRRHKQVPFNCDDLVGETSNYNRLAATNGGHYYSFNTTDACHFLLNLFLFLSTKADRPSLPFDQQSLNELFVQMYELIRTSVRDNPNERVLSKLASLLGLNVNADVDTIMQTFTEKGATIVFHNLVYSPSHYQELTSYPSKLVHANYESAERFELERIVLNELVSSSGVLFGPKYRNISYHIPKNVAMVCDVINAFTNNRFITHHDFLQCVENVLAVPGNYQLKKHWVHEYSIFDMGKIMADANLMRAKYNPVLPATLDAIQTIAAQFDLPRREFK